MKGIFDTTDDTILNGKRVSMRQDSFVNGLSDCYVSILCIFRILFHSIITLVYRSLLGFSYVRLLR